MSITPMRPGAVAPTWTMVDDRWNTARSEDYLSRWLIMMWQPVALRKGCQSCGNKVVPVVEEFRQYGADVVGVTMDAVPKNAEKALFVFDNQIPILSADYETAAAFQAARPSSSPWARVPHQITYLISPEGVIWQSWIVTHTTQVTHLTEVLNELPRLTEV